MEKKQAQGGVNNLHKKQAIHSLIKFLKNTLNIKEGVDNEATVNNIKKEITFRGHKVWILICSIFIASIGLTVDSTAVVIGAMLISPLMGPILGIGLSVGINDFESLKRSLKNFGIMVSVAMITSTVYFSIMPVVSSGHELLARTSPSLLDALIAIFGGVAGFISASRQENSTVIPGVAIATALMPPLCTAGFGLASGNWSYFFGAGYLFMLNTVFISAATFIMVKYLGFRIVQFIDRKKEKRVKRYILLFVLIIIIPSAWLFMKVVKESLFNARAETFINENINFDDTDLLKKDIIYSYDSVSRIELYMTGDGVGQEVQESLNKRLKNYGINNTKLIFRQIGAGKGDLISQLGKMNSQIDKMSSEVRVGIIGDLYEKNEKLLEQKELAIDSISKQLMEYQRDTIPFQNIRKVLLTDYDQLIRIAYANVIEAGREGHSDTIPTFILKWSGKTSYQEIKRNNKKIEKHLKARLSLDTLSVISQ